VTRLAPIVCIEGPSAVGKTTLAHALAAPHGAVVVPELDATGAPPIESAAEWFLDRHVEKWRLALDLRATAPLVVLDGDPFKGLWYNWMHAEAGWAGIEVTGPLYRDRVRRGELSFPDLYVYLDASEAQLRARKEGDAARRRGGFEGNVRKVEPQRRYFTAMRAAAPDRVAILDTDVRDSLARRVVGLVAALPPHRLPAEPLLEAMIEWVGRHAPDD
jgi:hypothetical protein